MHADGVPPLAPTVICSHRKGRVATDHNTSEMRTNRRLFLLTDNMSNQVILVHQLSGSIDHGPVQLVLWSVEGSAGGRSVLDALGWDYLVLLHVTSHAP